MNQIVKPHGFLSVSQKGEEMGWTRDKVLYELSKGLEHYRIGVKIVFLPHGTTLAELAQSWPTILVNSDLCQIFGMEHNAICRLQKFKGLPAYEIRGEHGKQTLKSELIEWIESCRES